MGKRSISQTNSLVGGIKDDIKALEEGVTVDEIESLTRGRADIIYDEIDAAGSPTDESVERTGPELSVGGQFKGGLRIRKHRKERLEPIRISSGDRKDVHARHQL